MDDILPSPFDMVPIDFVRQWRSASAPPTTPRQWSSPTNTSEDDSDVIVEQQIDIEAHKSNAEDTADHKEVVEDTTTDGYQRRGRGCISS